MKLSEILKIVGTKYNKQLQYIKKYDDGFRNDVFKVKDSLSGKFFVLIVYKEEERIKETIENAHAVAEFLKAKNFPARTPLESDSGNYFEVFSKRYLALYPFLPGDTIPWEAYKRRHLKSIGKTLSDMHYELSGFTKDLPEWKSEINKEINLMKKYFKKVEPWINRKLNINLNWPELNKALQLPDFSNAFPEVLHYDFVRGNILFSNKILQDDTYEITGILDFEKVSAGPVIADIVRTLSFLIVDCKYKKEEEIKKWFLARGYIKRGKYKVEIEDDLLERLLKIFWLRDFFKFLLHNPYENLKDNEHYMRTLEKLLERDLLVI